MGIINVRKVIGRQRKCILSSIFGLVAVHYLVLIHLILWKYPNSLKRVNSDVIGESWNDNFKALHVIPNQISNRDKRDLFQVGVGVQTNAANNNNQNPSADIPGHDYDTSVKEADDFDVSMKNRIDDNNAMMSNDNHQDFDTSVKKPTDNEATLKPDTSVGHTDHDKSGTSSDQTLLVLFSSWSYNSEKQNVHQTILRLWASWSKSLVQPLVFTEDSTVRHMALDAGWQVLPVREINAKCKGPPVLRGLFTDAVRKYDASFYGYANSDIIFGNGLIRTLQFLHKIYRESKHPVLIICRRYNYDFINNPVHLTDPSGVERLANYGMQVNQSTDIYIANAALPWDKISMVSVGRLYIARAIVTYAIKHKFDVIDATKTIQSIHLTTKDGNYASHNKPGRYCNYYALRDSKIRPSSLRFGHCECAKLETTFNKAGEIELRSRDPSVELCPASKK